MSTFQFLMLAASAFFAFKIYEHIHTLKDEEEREEKPVDDTNRKADAFSTFSPQALLQKADEAYENEAYERALSLLKEADTKEPHNAETLFKIGYIFQKQKEFQEALKYYKQALAIDKENEFIHNAMASIYRENREYTSARLHLQASLDIDDENPITYYNFGNLFVDMEHFEEAKAMYQKAITLNPDFLEAKEELEKLNEK